MRAFLDAHTDWLTVIRLPAYAAELNAVESVWSHLKRGLGNSAATNIEELVTIVKTRRKQLQYRPDLLDGFLGQTPDSHSNQDRHDQHNLEPLNLGRCQ